MMLLTMSRPLLESTIARRMRQRADMTVIEGTRITGLAHHDRRRITGVHVRDSSDFAPGMTMEADLVVDATGRGSATPRWLRETNGEAPDEEHVPVPIAYATCAFERGDDANDTRSIIVSGAPARRTGFVLPIEGRRWLASVGGFFDEQLPRTHDEFRAYVRSLPIPGLGAVINSREPVSDVVRFRHQSSLRRRYERLAAPPSHRSGAPPGLLPRSAVRLLLKRHTRHLVHRARLAPMPSGVNPASVEAKRHSTRQPDFRDRSLVRNARVENPEGARAVGRSPHHGQEPAIAFRRARGTRDEDRFRQTLAVFMTNRRVVPRTKSCRGIASGEPSVCGAKTR